ncbi:VanZ family protein [Lutimonas halocynthiae]|uniref:VanZ family protein n=1 Tax=Lutimonas halocynthiae TaxID=1446477 RepID=UPI0025B2EDC0|nr:VanZ family protein [Lutimonas halocynthiae]MDN3641449.1 VanZ family protein [Lutimonas halocynthiae]
MTLFTSKLEKLLWLLAILVFVVIFSTLFIGSPLLNLLSNQNIQAAIFLMGMILISALILYHGLKPTTINNMTGVYIGLVAVYLMLFLRLGLSERTHLMEYSVLSIFIYQALSERLKNSDKPFKPALFAILITCLIGTLDEIIQFFVPERVFDLNDIFFNCFAALSSIGMILFLKWVHKKIKKP